MSKKRTKPADDSYDFMKYMNARYRMIAHMSHDTQRARERIRSNPATRHKALEAAQKMMRADPSNPFAFARTLSQCMNGTALPSDFEADFRREVFPIQGADGSTMEGVRMVAQNVKLPTPV